MRNTIFLFLLTIIGLHACQNSAKRNLDIDTNKIDLEPVDILRYEKALFSIDPENIKSGLKTIAPDFPAFLSADLDDTLNIIQLHQFVTNPLNQKLFDSVVAKYPDLTFLEHEFTKAFKRFKHHFPEKNIPDVYTYVSGLLYEMPVQFFNDDMIIALDMYLGAGLEDYRKMRIPLYKIQNMNRNHIVKDAMVELFLYHFEMKPGKDFLQLMINKGKQLYFLDAMQPSTADHIKIGYTPEKLDWCVQNESRIWAFIIQNDLIYSSDSQINRKFFVDGPFTSDFSSDSPARIGEWMGWQVVSAYMNNNPEIDLQQLFDNQDAQKILRNSGYKPPA
jgi:hypothetical protein